MKGITRMAEFRNGADGIPELIMAGNLIQTAQLQGFRFLTRYDKEGRFTYSEARRETKAWIDTIVVYPADESKDATAVGKRMMKAQFGSHLPFLLREIKGPALETMQQVLDWPNGNPQNNPILTREASLDADENPIGGSSTK